MKRRIIVSIACLLSFNGGTTAQGQAAAAPHYGKWGVELGDQDRSVKPGDDFAMYQSGGWFARTVLSSMSPNAAYWRDVRLRAVQQLGDILAELAAKHEAAAEPGSVKAAAFYRAALDADAAERRGLSPLQPALAAI